MKLCFDSVMSQGSSVFVGSASVVLLNCLDILLLAASGVVWKDALLPRGWITALRTAEDERIMGA